MKMLCLFMFLLSFGFFSCSKTNDNNYNNNEQEGTFVFYKMGSPNDKWDVLINGQDYGPVPKTGSKPTCNSNKGLEVPLKPGTYTISFKNLSNNTTTTPKKVMLNAGDCKSYELQ